MKKMYLLVLLSFVVVLQAGTIWKSVKVKDDIEIFSQQKPNYKLKHYKAETRINKDTDTILAALQDTGACAEWVYNCISNDMVEMSDVRNRIYHTVIHSPLWFKDRDFYLQSHVAYDPEDQSFTITLTSKPEHAEASKNQVRVTEVEMIWNLKYLSDNMTAVTYQVYIDPKLPVKAINHTMIQKSIFRTMLGLSQLVDKPIYATTKYSASDLEMLTDDD